MNEYYKTLGLTQGATEAEIKRAYFKLVRQYTPESDPEMFQKIRLAYEQLKDGGNVSVRHPEFGAYTNSIAEKMMELAQNEFRTGNFEAGRDICEEGWKAFPKDIQFLYYLIFAQRKCGNTGKAVKNAEKLVKLDSSSMMFWRELAYSYFDRGFTKKAYTACEKAYELGCRETEFILMFSDECLYRQEFRRGWDILIELVKSEKRWKKEEMPDLFEALFRMLYMVRFEEDRDVYLESFQMAEETIKKYHVYVTSYAEEIATMLGIISLVQPRDSEIKEKIKKMMSLLDKYCSDATQKQHIEMIAQRMNLFRLSQDEQILDVLRQGLEAYFDYEDDEEALQKYMQLDNKLCMIEEREQVLAQMELIQREYPEYYDKIKDFVHRLENEKGILHLKESLKKDYDRLNQYYEGGYYYELYPHEKGGVSQVFITDGMGDTYVRAGKKIGRNDPCPCGSGKKYKQCCMQKK